jgi:Flavin containing amine oxidoreductase
MQTRRSFVQTGMSAATMGLLAQRGLGLTQVSEECADTGALPLSQSRPFLHLPSRLESEMVQGLPFAKWFTGDYFDNSGIPFHMCDNCSGDFTPPPPTEDVDVAVVGGGISGLCAAYLLREFNPVVFDLRPRFGGSAQGEVWGGTRYSLGSAYVITPDEGTFLDTLYTELGLPGVVRVDNGQMMLELNGQIAKNFWSGAASDPKEAAAYQRYAEIVNRMANENYPDIPLPEGKDNQWILDLDLKTLKQDIEDQMGMPIPALLASAIQSYCYSSFAAGWEEISAAGGWNFLAAEEFGRWVGPGGNAYMANAFWRAISANEPAQRANCSGHYLRGQCRVIDVRVVSKDRVQVTYIDSTKTRRSLLAKRVVMACSKTLAKHLLRSMRNIDEPKFAAMEQVEYRAYVMANVLLERPIELDFYDIFLLGDGNVPMSPDFAESQSRIIDMLNGEYARRHNTERSVLTLYWPLAYASARFRLISDDVWRDLTSIAAPDIHAMLKMLNLKPKDVRQVRMTRWGHAVPWHSPSNIALGVVDNIRRPLEGMIHFVNQDNWVLPAVENCLLDAEIYAGQIANDLRG